MSADAHQPVLLNEAVDALATGEAARANGVYVDATFGRGGHARLILDRLGPHGRLIALDRDASAVAAGRLITDPRFVIVHARFSELEETVRAQGVAAVAGVLIDLGVSSPQLDDPERGFSFRCDAPLDMRMDQTRGATAAEWLARASEAENRTSRATPSQTTGDRHTRRGPYLAVQAAEWSTPRASDAERGRDGRRSPESHAPRS